MTPDEQIAMAVLQCSRADLYRQDIKITDKQEEKIAAFKARLNSGEPLQYILGETEFFGVRIAVDKRVLIPRPETELMVDCAAKIFQQCSFDNFRILDLCTGSGCIAIALAKAFAGSRIVAVDNASDALDVARENAVMNGVVNRISFYAQDAVEYLRCHEQKIYDLIITNPPYIPTGELEGLPQDVKCEPHQALDGGFDGLKMLKGIIANMQTSLKPQGIFMAEFGDGQQEALTKVFDTFWSVEWMKDLSGATRFCIVRPQDQRS